MIFQLDDGVSLIHYQTAINQLKQLNLLLPILNKNYIFNLHSEYLITPGGMWKNVRGFVNHDVNEIHITTYHPAYYVNTEIGKEFLCNTIIHEYGHVFGLRHCSNEPCVMSVAFNFKKLKARTNTFCNTCINKLRENNNET